MKLTTTVTFRMYRAGLAAIILSTLFFPFGVTEPKVIAASGSPALAGERQKALLASYQSWIIDHTDLETFARLTELAAKNAGGDRQTFLDDLSSIIIGTGDSRWGVFYAPAGRLVNSIALKIGIRGAYPALLRFYGDGFRFNDCSNQVQHFWYAVISAYYLGADWTDLQARYHEWNAPGLLNLLPLTGHGEGSLEDLALTRQGIGLGRALAEGRMQPQDVPEWLRGNL